MNDTRNTETCNHPGCNKPIGNYLWGCDEHWWALPLADRIEIFTDDILNRPVDPALAGETT